MKIKTGKKNKKSIGEFTAEDYLKKFPFLNHDEVKDIPCGPRGEMVAVINLSGVRKLSAFASVAGRQTYDINGNSQ